ncbi:hypothetical protein EMCRGX_G020736 [Ephydatia muelleri]
MLSSVRAPGQLEEVGWALEPWVSQESSEDHGGYDCFLMAFDTGPLVLLRLDLGLLSRGKVGSPELVCEYIRMNCVDQCIMHNSEVILSSVLLYSNEFIHIQCSYLANRLSKVADVPVASEDAPADDRTAIPLSDICSIQVSTECSSTDDPGEQEIDVVDVSNVSQNPVEDTWSTIRETSGEITRTTLRSTCGTVVRFNLKSNKNGTSWKQIDFP